MVSMAPQQLSFPAVVVGRHRAHGTAPGALTGLAGEGSRGHRPQPRVEQGLAMSQCLNTNQFQSTIYVTNSIYFVKQKSINTYSILFSENRHLPVFHWHNWSGTGSNPWPPDTPTCSAVSRSPARACSSRRMKSWSRAKDGPTGLSMRLSLVGVEKPLKNVKDCESQLGWLFHVIWKIMEI